MRTKKIAFFLLLTTLMLGSLGIASILFSNADMPQTLREFRPKHVWLVVGPASGIILWFWALYDWGMRKMDGIRKFMWLMILIFTMGFGSIVYFIFLGLRREEANGKEKGIG